jgi:hypothetical protein
MTPSKAIKINCRFCHGGARSFPKCTSEYCSFNRRDLKVMERIRRGCRECAADHAPEQCNGSLLGVQRKILAELLRVSVEAAICPLHPFRLGKNVHLRRSMSEEQKKSALANLRPFKKRQNTVSKAAS